MPIIDPRIDAYIAAAAPFARPILTQLRETVHAACPDAEETIRWGKPSFTSAGRPLAHLAAFKAHASFGLWRRGAARPFEGRGTRDGMGDLGRLTSIDDLPDPATLRAMVIEAAACNAAPSPGRPRIARPEASVPPALAEALAADTAARATFDAFPPSCRREYCEWIAEAKRDDTRARRVAQTVERLRLGQRRHRQHERS